MHYDIDYSGLSEKQAKAKALRDIKEYLGTRRFNKIEADLKASAPIKRASFVFMLGFAGIQGFPAHVWYERLWPQADMHMFHWTHREGA